MMTNVHASGSRAAQTANSPAARAEDARTVLAAPGRSPEIPESADVYGWLIGSWDLEVLHYGGVDVAARGLGGEAHFGWALEGRAVQDAWIMPRRSARAAGTDKSFHLLGTPERAGMTGEPRATAGGEANMYGTTLRVWDPTIQAWRITWINPVSGHREEQIGRRVGPDIVQIGARPNGTPTRWRSPRSRPTRSTGSAKP